MKHVPDLTVLRCGVAGLITLPVLLLGVAAPRRTVHAALAPVDCGGAAGWHARRLAAAQAQTRPDARHRAGLVRGHVPTAAEGVGLVIVIAGLVLAVTGGLRR